MVFYTATGEGGASNMFEFINKIFKNKKLTEEEAGINFSATLTEALKEKLRV